MKRTTVLLPLLALLPALGHGGGTMDEAELLELLKQKPQIREFILQNFDMPKGAWGAVRIGSHYPHLGGKRLGPYTIQVAPKGRTELSPIVITLCTANTFYDASGKALPADSRDEYLAVRVQEKLLSVQLRQASEAFMAPACP